MHSFREFGGGGFRRAGCGGVIGLAFRCVDARCGRTHCPAPQHRRSSFLFDGARKRNSKQHAPNPFPPPCDRLPLCSALPPSVPLRPAAHEHGELTTFLHPRPSRTRRERQRLDAPHSCPFWPGLVYQVLSASSPARPLLRLHRHSHQHHDWSATRSRPTSSPSPARSAKRAPRTDCRSKATTMELF